MSGEDILTHSRGILRNSQVLKNLARHVHSTRGFSNVELECYLNRYPSTYNLYVGWKKVDDGRKVADQLSTLDNYSECKCTDYHPKKYRFNIEGGSMLRYGLSLVGPDPITKGADAVIVEVSTSADYAIVRVQLIKTSRDVGREEAPMAEHMVATQTGEYFVQENVLPSLEQFDEALTECVSQLGLDEWVEEICDADSDESDEAPEDTSKKTHKRSRSASPTKPATKK